MRRALRNLLTGLAVLLLVICNPQAVAEPQQTALRPNGTGPTSTGGDITKVESTGGVRTLRDIAYVTDPAPQQYLDLHLPRSDGPHPVVVWVHGGGWSGGDRTNDQKVWETYAERYAVVSVDYRLTPEAIWPAQRDDVLAALTFVHRKALSYDLDPDRIVVAGMSAGAQLAAVTGLQTDVPITGILVFGGPTVIDDPALLAQRHDTRSITGLLGCDPTTAGCATRAADASARTWIRRGAPPVFLQHSRDDDVVPLSTAMAFETALRQAGVDLTTEYLNGGGHIYELTFWVTAFLEDALACTDQCAKGDAGGGSPVNVMPPRRG